MPVPIHDPLAPPLPDRRLTGWKEIAAYLDKGVRTVQRWERDFGLPVRRMGGDRLESVFAFASELDTWLASASAARAKGAQDLVVSGTAGTTLPSTSLTPSVRHRRVVVLAWVLGAAAVVLTAAGIWVWALTSGRPGPPTDWRVDRDILVVLDAAGRTVFDHSFGVPLAEGDLYAKGAAFSDRFVGIDDVDGDGRREVWFVAAPADDSGTSIRGLYLFNQDGTVRWTYRFDGHARFGDRTFGPPWHPHFTFVTASPDGRGARAIWATNVERAEFPAVLRRLDVETGTPLSTYWSNGYVTSLALSTLKGRPVALVGAANNEHKASSMAVLDALNPNGSSPAVNDKYRCTDCPAGGPLAFVVFPKPARFASIGESGCILALDGRQPGEIVVRPAFAWAGAASAVAIFRLDEALRPTGVDTSDGYQAVYDALLRKGVLPPHNPAAVDPDHEFLPILHWSEDRFISVGKRSP